MTSDGPHGHPDGVPVSRPADVAPRLDEVLERSRELGFLGPGAVSAHLANGRAFLRVLDEVLPATGSPRLLDLGSGGGVPGLVVAWGRADLEVTLLDASSRRTAFLREAVGALDLGARVRVERGRAEELAHRDDLRHRFQVVTARSFGPPAVTAECAAGFLGGPGSVLLVSEPPEIEGRWPERGLAALGLSGGRRRRWFGATIQEIGVVAELDDRFPRRVGVPAKRPLFG